MAFSKMKTESLLLTRNGSAEKAFKLSEINLPELQKHQVLIEVEAFGLNYADVMIRRGLHSEKPKLPCILGYEVVGTVIKAYDKANNNLIGARVAAFTKLGAYSRHVIANVEMLCPIDNINANTALALVLQGITAYYMSNYIAPIKTGETVLIHAAAGGVGTLLIQLAKYAGAKVIAKVSSEEKRQKCLELGADFAINYKTHNYAQKVEKFIGKRNLDVSFNPIGGKTFRQDLKLMGAGSKMILFSGAELMAGKFGIFSQLNFLLKMGVIIPIFQTISAKSIIGINMLELANTKPYVIKECLTQMICLYQQEIIKPINGGEFKFTELAKANSLLESGKSSGKISVCW